VTRARRRLANRAQLPLGRDCPRKSDGSVFGLDDRVQGQGHPNRAGRKHERVPIYATAELVAGLMTDDLSCKEELVSDAAGELLGATGDVNRDPPFGVDLGSVVGGV